MSHPLLRIWAWIWASADPGLALGPASGRCLVQGLGPEARLCWWLWVFRIFWALSHRRLGVSHVENSGSLRIEIALLMIALGQPICSFRLHREDVGRFVGDVVVEW